MHFQKYLKNHWDIILNAALSVAVAAALTVLSVLPFYVKAGYHDTQRMVSTVIIALALFTSILWIRVSKQTMWLLGAAYVWGLVAVCMSPLPLWSMLEFGLIFSVVLVSVTLIPRLQKLQLMHLATLIGSIHAFYAAHNLLEYAFTLFLGRTFEPFAMSNGFSNVRFYGQFLIWTVPFLVGTLVIHPKFSYRNVLIGLLMFDWAFEFLTLTRAFLFAMVVTVPMVRWTAKKYWLQYTKYLTFTAIIGFVIYLSMLYALPSLLGADISYAVQFSSGRDMLTSSGRMQLWQDTWSLMLNHPWFGAGPMMTALDFVSKIAAHPHNYILQLLAEWGIPFTLLLCGGVVFGMIKWKKLIERSTSDNVLMALPITASLSAGAAGGLVDGLFVMPVSLVYMSLVMACFAGLWRTLTPEVQRHKFPLWSIAVLIAPSIFTAVFAVINWPHRSSDTDNEIPKPMSGNGYQLQSDRTPRFWLTGKIAPTD